MKSINVSKLELMYLLFFFIITIGKGIGLNASNSMLQVISIIAFIFLGVKILLTIYNFKEIIICCALVILGIIVSLVAKKTGLFLSILTIIGLKNVSYRKVMKVAFIARAVTFISVISMCMVGIIEKTTFQIWRDGAGYVDRYALGFEHPNLLHNALFILVILFIYLYYERINIMHYLAIFGINYFIYSYSGSRTGYYSIILIIVISIFLKKVREKSVIYKLFNLVLPVLIFIAIFTAINFNKVPLINKLDGALTGRIRLGNYYINAYAVNLFGNDISQETSVIDNSYLNILINYGLIAMILFIYSYYKIINRFAKEKMQSELMMITMYLISGFTESFLPNAIMNLSLLFIGDLLFKENKLYKYSFTIKKNRGV